MKHSLYPADGSPQASHELLARLAADYKAEERAAIAEALELAVQARDRDTLVRPRGIDVAHIVHHLKVDAMTVKVALLSDPYLRDTLELGEIGRRFGEATAELVKKVNWLNTFDEYRPEEARQSNQTELLRRMLLAVVNDVRGVLVKLAYRLQRLRLLKDHPDEALRRKIARETLDIFAPLANRLGVGQLKWELEDLAFRYLNREEYRRLARSLAANRAEREGFIHRVITELRQALEAHGIPGRVFGRPKHIYSIHRKLERKAVPLDELYDIHAVRVIVADVATCYAVLGVVHSRWLHIPKEFDDYIANPKENGYQSLHTVVVGPEGRPVEIQIRTEAMHAFAEYGVAAHWRYKEGGEQDHALDRSINALRRLLDSKDDDQSVLENLRAELFADQIFVLTPKGEVIRLRKGATPVDFAYAIHTEVGHRCRGAKVNGRIVPLNYELHSGEKVEILTAKYGGPSLGWLDPHLGYVKTAHARNKIRQWFKQQDHERHLRAGKAILERERQKMGVKELDLDELARHFHLPKGEDLLLSVGRADIAPAQLANVLRLPGWQPPQVPVRKPPLAEKPSEEITIQGVRNLLTHLARCCGPVPGDPIIGYVTLGRGIAIHRQDCGNIVRLPAEKHGRLIDVGWGTEPEAFPVEIAVRAIDRKGLLKDITQILASEHINILRSHSVTDPSDRSVLMEITVEVADLAQLSLALDRIGAVHNVVEARRKEPG
ncbi:RelA/SpoT family protein [Candidatus Methylocalor cossyra]|uniref:GTP pyrophosphokinase n=1 Tax=Candidatus Methylocalor cossyra TaxID=3108543 RepID=A0ABM9NIT4_9GAMM